MSNIFDYDGLSVAARLALLNELRQQYEALAPTPEMWANAPEWAQWYTIDPNGDAWLDKDEPSTGMREWKTYSDEYVVIHTVNLPIGIDWRLCKWQRPA